VLPAPLPPDLQHDLHTRLADVQRHRRLPSATAAVFAGGAGWHGEVAAGPDEQFRIGSITKTFTAVLILQLRDEGQLRLSDPLDRHLPGTAAGDRTLRELLAHTAGVRREPPGPFWEAVEGGTTEQLLAEVDRDALVLPPGTHHHYSNLAYGLLGAVVERLRAAPWRSVVRDRLLRPLELARTTYLPEPPYARGHRGHPFLDELSPEPTTDAGAMAPAGQLWSTARELCTWGAVFAEPVEEVLAGATVAEMCTPVVITDAEWTAAHGLGVQLWRVGEQILVGHGGSMPGFGAGLAVSRSDGVTAAFLANRWQGVAGSAVARELALLTLGRLPRASAPTPVWQSAPAPPEVAELVGMWFFRGAPLIAFARDGALHLRLPEQVGPTAGERYAAVETDVFRGEEGDDRGEFVFVRRDEAGVPVVLEVAGWPLTRTVDDPRGGP